MRRIVISGLVALAAVLGGVAVPASAMAQPTTMARAGSAVAMRTARVAPASEAAEGATDEPTISCVLSTDCLGVEGTSSLSDGGSPKPTRAARWNGSSWRGVGVALPKGTKSDDLNSVSCQGAKSCLVVGDYYTSTSENNAASHVLALFYNGTSLKPTPAVPLPKGTTDAALASVSCVTTTYCVAIGAADGDTSAFGEAGSLNLIETWNGAKWTLHTAAGSIGTTAQLELTAVSCGTSAFCVLTGTVNSFTSTSLMTKLYIASWNGRKLTTMNPVTVSSGAGFVTPSGVSCATASNCAVTGAVLGAESTSSTIKSTAFTEIWNGKAWQLAKVAWPKGATSSLTLSVSCYAAHSCEVAGVDGANVDTSFDAAAVSFKGTAGTLQAVPAPPKGDVNALVAVSCLPWGSCVAIGETGKTASSPALMTGVWSGKTWKLDPGF